MSEAAKTNALVTWCNVYWHTTPANLLTHSRTPMAVAGVGLGFCSWHTGHVWMTDLGLVLLIIASATDAFDGWVARRFGCVTEYGGLLDTAQDKIFLVAVLSSCLIPVSLTDSLHAVILVFFLILNVWRDNYVMMFRLIGVKKGLSGIAQWYGKVRTGWYLVFCCYLFAYAFDSRALDWAPAALTRSVCLVLEAVVASLTIASWIGYAKHYGK